MIVCYNHKTIDNKHSLHSLKFSSENLICWLQFQFFNLLNSPHSLLISILTSHKKVKIFIPKTPEFHQHSDIFILIYYNIYIPFIFSSHTHTHTHFLFEIFLFLYGHYIFTKFICITSHTCFYSLITTNLTLLAGGVGCLSSFVMQLPGDVTSLSFFPIGQAYSLSPQILLSLCHSLHRFAFSQHVLFKLV